jgi:hypothetical protein
MLISRDNRFSAQLVARLIISRLVLSNRQLHKGMGRKEDVQQGGFQLGRNMILKNMVCTMTRDGF